MLNKLAVLLLTLTALGGCGYKGALYIPDAPSQNTPPSSDVSSDASFEENDQASNTQSTALKFVSSSSRRATLIHAPLTTPLTNFGDSN